ncbi:MAG: hypothetical protein U1F43_32585 [Myxococcota bacterium]
MLDKTNGKVKVSLPIGVLTNGDRKSESEKDGLLDDIKQGAQSHKVDLELELKDGKISSDDLKLELLKVGFPIAGELASLGAHELLTVERVRKLLEDKVINTAPSDKKNEWVQSIEFDVQAQVQEKGHVKIGPDFEGDVKAGSTIGAKTEGDGLGKQITVDGKDVGAEKVKLMNGDVRVDDLQSDTLHVEVKDLEGKYPEVKADIEGAKLKNVEYGDAGKGDAAIAKAGAQTGPDGVVQKPKSIDEQEKEAKDVAKKNAEEAKKKAGS